MFELRSKSLSAFYEVDYYESLPYYEAEKFCEIIGGTMLEEHSASFQFDLWIPKRNRECVKYQAFGAGEIIADCKESYGSRG